MNEGRRWTPHDARRILSSFLADEELGGAGRAILAHSSGKENDEDARVEDITRKVYAQAQRFPLKARNKWIRGRHALDAYERERSIVERILRSAPPVEIAGAQRTPEASMCGPGRQRKPKAEKMLKAQMKSWR